MKLRSNQTGATLMEALSFLAIAAIVILGALSLLNRAFISSNVGTHQKELNAIRLAIVSFAKGQGGYTSVNEDNLIAVGGIPSTMFISGTSPTRTITNLYGGAVTLSGTASTFSISDAGIPASDCANLVAGINNFTTIKIGSATAVTTPYPPTQAVTDCTAGTPPNTIVMTSN